MTQLNRWGPDGDDLRTMPGLEGRPAPRVAELDGALRARSAPD